MNRVQRFAAEDSKKRNNVGFALQILQRRLASSPAAIYQSLKRRRERLEAELAEARLMIRGKRSRFDAPDVADDALQNLEELGQDEIDDIEDRISPCQRRSKIGPWGGAKLGHFGFTRVMGGGQSAALSM